jgi:hypothetical protein
VHFVLKYSLVITNISKMDADRKCFRLIGGVLVERTVGVVLPDVTQNRDGVSMALHWFVNSAVLFGFGRDECVGNGGRDAVAGTGQ